MPPNIEALDLHKTYGPGQEVLKGVSFAVPAGSVYAYLGRNGAGKSTTVRILSTLTKPTRGTARIQGVDVVADPADVRRRIGVTMQHAALDDYSTARQNIELVAQLWGMSRSTARQRADELLEAFGLADAADKLVTTFSGGMRRRADIALSLVNRPQVLFLDEPTTGLDPQSRRALWVEINGLRNDGAAILLTTQYLEEAQELADNVGVIHDGRLVAEGRPDDLRRSVSRTVVQLLSADPDASRVTGIASRFGTVERDRSGSFRVELPGESSASNVTQLLGDLHSDGVELRSVQVTEPSLEDAYLRLTGASINAGPVDAKAA